MKGFGTRVQNGIGIKVFMRSLMLCRERLNRLLTVLNREGGECSVRRMARNFAVPEWEVEQAETLGWVAISERKPAVGRPSKLVEVLSETPSAKLPPWRNAIPKEISIRHYNFAFQLACPNARCNGLQSATEAYLRSFPCSRSRAGAAASAHRLLKKPMIQAAQRWFNEYSLHRLREPMPRTPSAIYARLAELRARSRA